uniref:WGS project CBME000000000 data, contig CS3487_c000528 n=1 Tax=Fusarium pseudograminearum CS3487 TaxID=1318458 RepID=A0A096PDG1_FUSPS|nr:unnamed protein product [Fusarium pseudograminearum CS3487]
MDTLQPSQVPLDPGLFSLLDGSQQASPQVCVLWASSLSFIQSEEVARRSHSQSGRKPSTHKQAPSKQDETQASSRHPRSIGVVTLCCTD